MHSARVCTANNITGSICTNLTVVFRDCTATYASFLFFSPTPNTSVWLSANSQCKVNFLQWSSWVLSVKAVCTYQRCLLHNRSNYWHCLWKEMCFYFQMWAILWSYFSLSKIPCFKKKNSWENMWILDKEIENMGLNKHSKLSQINPDRVSLYQGLHKGMPLIFTFVWSSPFFSYFKKGTVIFPNMKIPV